MEEKKWLLQFEETCKVIDLERGYPTFQYHMRNTTLSTTETKKDLGLYHVSKLPMKGYPVYQYQMEKTPLSTTEAVKVTHVPVPAEGLTHLIQSR